MTVAATMHITSLSDAEPVVLGVLSTATDGRPLRIVAARFIDDDGVTAVVAADATIDWSQGTPTVVWKRPDETAETRWQAARNFGGRGHADHTA